MNFAAAIAEVNGVVKRPDKLTTVKLAINTAINQVTLANLFPRDLVEMEYNVPAQEQSDYSLSIPLSTFSNYRKFKYIRATNDNRVLTKRHPDKVFTREGYEQFGSYYTAGANLKLKLRAPATKLLIGYYAKPPYLTQDADTHWLLDDFPTVIIAIANAISFQTIGQDKDAQYWNGIAQYNARALGLDQVEPA